MDDQPPYLQMPTEQARQQLQARIDLGRRLLDRANSAHSSSEIESLLGELRNWGRYNKTLLDEMFSTAKVRLEYDAAGMPTFLRLMRGTPSLHDRLNGEVSWAKAKVQCLDSVLERLPLFEKPGSFTQPRTHGGSHPLAAGNVFVVHGHDEGLREQVARFVEKIGLQPVILHEKPSSGRTLLEKLEAYSTVPFAIVLLTGDDHGGEMDDPHLHPRARQNVVFELGYFFGALRRRNVAVLYEPDVELPTDVVGLTYISTKGNWRVDLAKELHAAGLAIDLNRVLDP